MTRLMIAATMLLVASAPVFAQGATAKVADLGWMTGSYANDTLEENWAEPKGGSIAALVRGYGDGANNLIELIVVEEVRGSLVLRWKQWNPGMEERTAGFEVMDLVDIGDKTVAFKDRGEDGTQSVRYSLSGDTFTISMSTSRGDSDISLTRVSPK